ncbi:hypothetical protein [Gorillibacterium sp. sgz5001074]|uniref:hypothetical protein n=1 Tax=Gorillibacterium sp. sgz5001074 TaxID=3446695 RepID=UPI003F681331
MLGWLQAGILVILAVLFLTAYAFLRRLFGLFSGRRRRFRLREIGNAMAGGRPPEWLMKACFLSLVRAEAREEWRQLLSAAGIRMEPLWYLVLRRSLAGFLAGAGIWMWRYGAPPQLPVPLPAKVSALLTAGGALLVHGDRYVWNAVKRYRTNRIVEEIFAVSRQLLYFDGSPLHLHGKLSRCLPYTRLIRQEWHLLLNDWYHDQEGAVRRFRERLGTEEAHGFAETIQSLRQYDGEAYYELLRQRVQDYKEKLELHRDSRKESVSYVLFVLAGLPIMYTFQIFIHPWVQEGRRLFDSLG